MSDAAIEYDVMMRRLVVLINEGRGDSVEADVLRDEMDRPWNLLTDDERESR